uniref:Uncharacterized protein n=1 Tax=Alexandrium catenella TaxID=2925 RepID=A0A7S1W4B8_ALECA
MDLQVPANLYGMAIAEPPQLSVKHDGRGLFVTEIARVYFMLLINYFVCSLFVLQINEMNDGAEHHCSAQLVLLEFICVFIFEVQMLVELQESAGMVFLVLTAKGPQAQPQTSNRLSRYTQAREASPTSGAVLVNEDSRSGSWLKRMTKRLRKTEDGPQWTFEGISWKFKAWSLVVVAVPKVLLGLALAYIGGIYIIKSKDAETMVMSTLAVVFIADIDAILYEAFTSSAMRCELEDMEPVEVPLSNAKRLGLWLASGILAPLAVAAVSVAVMWRIKQQDCHGEVWSVSDMRAELMHHLRSSITGIAQ